MMAEYSELRGEVEEEEGDIYDVFDEDFETVKRNHYSQFLVIRFVERKEYFDTYLLWIITKV